MRIHIYDEELGDAADVSIIKTTALNTGARFVGLRIWLESPETLHSSPDDDDRSAVTIWAEDSEEGLLMLEDLCHEMMLAVISVRDG